MAEQASQVARCISTPIILFRMKGMEPNYSSHHREAKALQQGLKESLKTREPWDRDVNFHRIKFVP
jgi:hypothetical protein